MTTPAIKVEGLGKNYRLTHGQERTRYRTLRESLVDVVKAPFRSRGTTEEFWALNDVSFAVHTGEVVGIIGRNGAGKSTLLKILSRITKPGKGRVEITGRVGSLLEVGTGFHPELTGRENIFLNGSILGMSRREIAAKFDEIVAFAEVERFLDTPVKRYSSGMYVRLAFAVAAHLEPEILIVDEVLAVGDAEFQRKCMAKMSEVGHSGRTILFVSHNMAAVENLCTRGILLSAGRVEQQGPVHQIIAAYQKRDQSRSGGVVDLTTHPNRRGSPARLRQLRVSSNGVSGSRVRMGEPLEIEIEYDCGTKPSDLKLGLTVEDARGTKVVSFSPTYQTIGLLRASAAKGTAQCSIPAILLVEGLYRVHIYYANGDESASVEGACDLEVLAADVFGSGHTPGSTQGVIYLPCHWQLCG